MSHKNYYITGLTALIISAAVAFAPSSSAALTAYSQDFEAMTPLQGYPPNDLSDDGWRIFGFAWDANPYPRPSSANLAYQYGPYDAANGAPGSIQGVATGEGGPDQGDVVLAKFSDYNDTCPRHPVHTGQYIPGTENHCRRRRQPLEVYLRRENWQPRGRQQCVCVYSKR